MKYKVNDGVRIKSLDWYNANKDEYGYIDCGSRAFFTKMSDLCGKIATIKEICKTNCYRLEEYDFDWTDEMIEGLVEEETLIERVDDNGLPFNEWLSHKGAFYIPDGYELKDENGNVINATKIVLEKKKKEYPKTYEECCKILGHLNVDLCFNADYRSFDASKEQWKRLGLMNQFYQLLICRDAYWQIAGEEMGLGKDLPWVPDWMCIDPIYVILYQYHAICRAEVNGGTSCILAFPTAEMRDAFYENFKELIESCKELL